MIPTSYTHALENAKAGQYTAVLPAIDPEDGERCVHVYSVSQAPPEAVAAMFDENPANRAALLVGFMVGARALLGIPDPPSMEAYE